MHNRVPWLVMAVCFGWAAVPASSQVPLRESGLASVVDPAYGNAAREYYVGADQHVHELFLSGGKWSDGDLFAIAPSPNVAAGSPLTSVFDPLYKGVRTDYIATDQHVHELFLSGGSWQSADLTSAAAGTAVSVSSSLVSIIDPNYDNAVREYYVGADQHVHELFLYGGHWQDADLIAATEVRA